MRQFSSKSIGVIIQTGNLVLIILPEFSNEIAKIATRQGKSLSTAMIWYHFD